MQLAGQGTREPARSGAATPAKVTQEKESEPVRSGHVWLAGVCVHSCPGHGRMARRGKPGKFLLCAQACASSLLAEAQAQPQSKRDQRCERQPAVQEGRGTE